MKKAISFLIKNVILPVLLLTTLTGQSQTTSVVLTYNGTGLQPGDVVSVPVVFTSTANVGAWQVVIYYNRDVLTYTSGDPDPIWGGSGFPVVFNNNYTPTQGDPLYVGKTCIKIGWSSATNYTCNPITAFTLNFTYHGGTTNLTVINKNPVTANTYSSYIKNPTTVNTGVTWTNGTANGNLAAITAIYNGNWSSSSIRDLGHKPNSSNGDVYINGSVVTLDENAAITGDVTVNVSGAFTINSGKTLTASGNLIIKSNASGTGSFINNGTYTASNTTVERYLPAWPSTTSTQGWHLICSPVANHSLSNFTPSPASSYDFFKWDEPTSIWLDQKIPANNISSFETGIGYLVSYQNAGVRNFSGTLINSDVSPNLSYTANSYPGWNVIGNPFTSAISGDINTWTKSNVNDYLYVWDDAIGNYVSWNGFTGSLNNGIIPAMQGFLVRTNNANPSITIPLGSRVHDAQSYYKSSSIDDIVKINVQGPNGLSDNTIIYFTANTTDGLDENTDAPKVYGSVQEAPQLYSYIGTNKYSINAMGSLTSVSIPLGFEPRSNGTFTLKASDVNSFAFGTVVTLQDLKTNTFQNLYQNNTYNFSANINDDVNRFVLHFNTALSVNENSNTTQIYAYDNQLYVNTTGNVKQITIYNTLGQLIYSVNNPDRFFRYNLNGNNTGYYIVKVITDNNVSSEKIFVK